MTFLPLVLLGLVGAEQVIDTFEYADAQAARQAWVAAEGTPAVDVAQDDGRPVVRLTAPFAADAKLKRSVIDRRVSLDLSAVGEFALKIAVDPPQAAGQLTLYFRSGGGWYGAGAAVTKPGWQTVRVSKASFRSEGTPTGWAKIDAVRIAAWRIRDQDAAVRLGKLAALTHEVALVVPAGGKLPADSETRTAHDTAAHVAELLQELGLGSDAIEDSSLAGGALGDRRVAILAYNPRLATEATAALEKFIEGGGKVVVCYTLPERLGRALGFGNAKYVGQKQPGYFAQMIFKAENIEGLPDKVDQASWNITDAAPVGHNARVVGRWSDDAGKPTGHAALLVSDRGAFFSHIILGDDPEGKRQLLAALLGHFAPSLWRQMARAADDRVGQIGHCQFVEEVAEYVRLHAKTQRSSGVRIDRAIALMRPLNDAEREFKSGRQHFDKKEYSAAVGSARAARGNLATAYLRATPSREREGRGVWNHSGLGAYPGDWDRSAKELAQNGFNMVMPNMLWGGLAHYASDILPRSDVYEKHGDQIQQCVTAGKKHGVEVHVWKVNYNLSNAPKDFVEKMRRAGRTQATVTGTPQDWLCPSHPENQKLELESMLEVARKYAVDGLHFDYIRYPGRECCYCDGCRNRFEAESGQGVAHWPDDCYSGPRRGAYHDWRCKQITALVATVHREGKKLRPKLKISAAVFGSYPGCRESVGQDWPAWIKAGYLDFVCPMDYSLNDEEFSALVENQLKLAGGRIPVYPGIGATASRSTLSADRVVGQIHFARKLGAAGFMVFNFDRGTAGSIIPGVGLGAGSQRAVPPHR